MASEIVQRFASELFRESFSVGWVQTVGYWLNRFDVNRIAGCIETANNLYALLSLRH